VRTGDHTATFTVSHIWYKFPSVIRADRLSAAQCDFPAAFGPLGGSGDLFGPGGDFVEIPWTSAEQRALAPTGQFSDNSRADREKGRRYHDYMVGRLVKFIEWWRTYAGPLGRG
jgi:creatinine amidohydrolase